MNVLERLNPAQLRAATFLDGPCEVIAGPGTGKTTVLGGRVYNLVEEKHVPPNGVYVITFTRKARGNLQAKLEEDLSPGMAEQVNVSTIDALAYRICVADAQIKAGDMKKKIPTVADEDLAFSLFSGALEETGYGGLKTVKSAWGEMRKWKMGKREYRLLDPDLVSVVERYQERLIETKKWDVSDLIWNATHILRDNSVIAAAFQVSYMMVDEWQDTSLPQYHFLREVLKHSDNLFVVGAPAQSIYTWRNADYTRLSDAFVADYLEAELVKLDTNYRSGRKIVAVAASVVLEYPEVHLKSDNGEGAVFLHEAISDDQEASIVANVAKTLVDENGMRWQDIAILFRTWAQRAPLEAAFLDLEIPYVLADDSRLPFYKTPEVLAMIGYLRAIMSVRGEIDASDADLDGALDLIINTPSRRGIGPVSLNMIRDGQPEIGWNQLLRAQTRDDLRPQVRESVKNLFEMLTRLANDATLTAPEAMMNTVLEETGWEEYLAGSLDGNDVQRNLHRLRSEAAEHNDIVAYLNLMKSQLGGSWNMDGVALTSIHAAKGLEWPVVFVVGMNEGVLPHVNAIKGNNTPHEEKRLAHVAFSRAMKVLFITYARNRRDRSGQYVTMKPSRFLGMLPTHEVTRYDKETFGYQLSGNGISPAGSPWREPDAETFFG